MRPDEDFESSNTTSISQSKGQEDSSTSANMPGMDDQSVEAPAGAGCASPQLSSELGKDEELTDILFDVEGMQRQIVERMRNTKAKDVFYNFQETTILNHIVRRSNEANWITAYVENLQKTIKRLVSVVEHQTPSSEREKVLQEHVKLLKRENRRTKRDLAQYKRFGPPSSDDETSSEDEKQQDPPPEPALIPEVKRWKTIEDRFKEREFYDDDVAFNNAGGRKTGSAKHVVECFRHYTKDKIYQGTSITIHSRPLIDLVKRTVGYYPGNDFKSLSSDHVSIDEPYMILFHNRVKLQCALLESAGEAQAHLQLLLEFLRNELPRVAEKLDEIEQSRCSEISYDEVWLLYTPRTIVYSQEDDEWRAYKVERLSGYEITSSGHRAPLRVDISSAGFNDSGDDLIWYFETATVYPYNGNDVITTFKLIPENFVPNRSSLQSELPTRGKEYWNYRGRSHYREYLGAAWHRNDATEAVRVIVDYVTTSSPHGDMDARGLRKQLELEEDASMAPQRHRPRHGLEQRLSRSPSHSPTRTSPLESMTVRKRSRSTDKEDEEYIRNMLLFCPAHVFAFSLRNKDWRDVKTKELKDVTFNEKAFRKLVIERRYKAIVTAMVRSYLKKTTDFKDLIQGKGRGLVVLLHGSPGTGKTLTAECVAESEERPMYIVTCGNLGTNPTDLENNLRETFEYAVNWKAVLLLDEADVFLQERDIHDLKRNALVSVFLRELEYFDGIMFLTTNRPGALDEAFQSRIHITLRLPDLDPDSRLKIWAIFVQELEISHGDKESLMRNIQKEVGNENLNGRQIRNCIRAALAMAAQDNVQISGRHIKDIVEIGKKFTSYMNDVNAMDVRQRQAAMGMRLA
ncbi:MAG: hypothetical protein Q9187_004841 [Circinaria calcarea]